jgi:hypothetical protein
MQNPDQQFEVTAVIRDVGNKEFTKKGAEYVVCRLDDGQETGSVKVYKGNGELPTLANVNQKASFKIKGYKAQNNRIYLSGFWNNEAGVQDSPQTLQNRPQSTNAPQRDATGVSIERQCVVKAVCGVDGLGLAETLTWCQTLHSWVATGQIPCSEPATGAPIPDDDIPF